MKQTLKILLLRLLVLALLLGGISVYLRTTANESVTPLVKHFAKEPSLTWSKVWLTMYGYDITSSDKDSITFDNGYWSGAHSDRGTSFTHNAWFSNRNIEADAGAVIGELRDLCGGYRPMGSGIVFSYDDRMVYVILPNGLIDMVTVSLLLNPGTN